MFSGANIPKVVMPTGGTTVVKKNASVKDTVNLIDEISTAHAHEVAEVANYLAAESVEDTCRNIWNHVRKFVYREDKEGVEQLRTPARSFHEGVMDCDCATLYISALLKNLNIPHIYRVVAWEEKQNWAHIYPVAFDGKIEYIIDFIPEVPYFNYELKNVDQMNIEVLNGYAKVTDNLNGVVTLAGHVEVESDGAELNGAELANLNTQDVYESIADVRNELATQMEKGINPLSCVQKQELDIIDKIIISFNFEDKTKEAIDNAAEQSQFKEFYKACSAQLAKNDELKTLTNVRMLNTKPVGGKLSNFIDKVKTVVSNTVTNIKDVTKPGGVKEIVGDIKDAVVKYSPLTVSMRLGVLAAMRGNVKGIAKKLRWAYLTPAQAKAKGMSDADHVKVKAALVKTENLFTKLGGDKTNLKEAIQKGGGTLNGALANPAVAAAATPENIQAASGILQQVLDFLKGISFGGNDDGDEKEYKLPLPGTQEFKNFDANNDGKLSPEEQQAIQKLKSMETKTTPSTDAPSNTDGWLKRTWNDPKKKWWLVGGSLGLVLIIILVIWLATRKSKKKNKPMNGRRKYAIQVRPIRRKVKQPKQLAMRLAGASTPMLNGRKKVAKRKKTTTKKRR